MAIAVLTDKGYQTEGAVPFKGSANECKSKGIDKGNFFIINADTNYIQLNYYGAKGSKFTEKNRNYLLGIGEQAKQEKSEYKFENHSKNSDKKYTYY